MRCTMEPVRNYMRWEFHAEIIGHVQMTRGDYEEYDYLIGMDTWNIRNMNRIVGSGSRS